MTPFTDMTKNKKGQLALITGAGHRLGREIALHVARLGYSAVIHYHASEKDAEQTRKMVEDLGVKAYSFQADLTQKSQIDDLFSYIETLKESLQVLINSAAIMRAGPLNEASMEDWDLTFNLNLRAVWWCGRLASKLMPGSGGVIINISDSGAGRLWTKYPAYSISKAGVEILTRMMAKTYAPHIRVNAIAPGLILPPDDFPEETWDKLINRLPLKHSGTPNDICKAIEFLMQNKYVTGEILTIDGGYQLV